MSSAPEGEDYLLEDGEGLIEVRGDGFDSGLLVGGAPVAFLWSDCGGSIGQYLVRSRDTAGLSERLRALRQVAGGGLDPRAPLAPQIRPLLALFSSGRYRLSYTPALGLHMVVAYGARFSYTTDRDSIYPFNEMLITTRPSDVLRRDRVDFFRERIAAGERPIVFTAGVAEAYGAFVLDGHHKLQAYGELGLPPAVLSIVKAAPDPIALEDGLRLMGEAACYRDDYRQVKQQYGGIASEAEWLACTVPWKLAEFMRTRTSDRKKRLLMCACCRQEWRRLRESARRAVEVAERFADGLADEAELAAACRAAEAARGALRASVTQTRQLAAEACRARVEIAPAYPAREGRIIPLMRDVFGNPFRPVVFEPSWRTSAVVALARAAYDERTMPAGTLDPARLSILADAFEDAGCDLADVLGHLRGPGPHVRGCWVVGAALGLA